MTEAGKMNFVGECGCWPFETFADIYAHRAAASTILSVVYDIPTVSSADDPTVTRINQFNEIALEYANQGNYLVEFFPWMLYIPSSLAKWKREAREGYHHFTELFEGMVHDVQHRIVRAYLTWSGCLVIYACHRTKGMNDRVLQETCFEDAIATTSVTWNLLGYLLQCSTCGSVAYSFELKFTSRSSAGAETVRSGVIEGFDYLRFADRYLYDLVFSRHDCIPGEAKEVSRGA